MGPENKRGGKMRGGKLNSFPTVEITL